MLSVSAQVQNPNFACKTLFWKCLNRDIRNRDWHWIWRNCTFNNTSISLWFASVKPQRSPANAKALDKYAESPGFGIACGANGWRFWAVTCRFHPSPQSLCLESSQVTWWCLCVQPNCTSRVILGYKQTPLSCCLTELQSLKDRCYLLLRCTTCAQHHRPSANRVHTIGWWAVKNSVSSVRPTKSTNQQFNTFLSAPRVTEFDLISHLHALT